MMLSVPLKRAVVSDQCEASAEEIRRKFENGPLEGETLLLDVSITAVTVEELSTGICQGMFGTLGITLGHDSAQTNIGATMTGSETRRPFN